jgi:hypothetical protein
VAGERDMTIGHTVPADSEKIDSLATDGMNGVANSLASRVHEVERHVHSYEVAWETAAVANGGTHVADRIGDGSGAFQADAANDDWGTWIQLLGSADTPVIAGNTHYDLHRVEISAAERNAVYFLQLGYGASGSAALTNNTYSSSVVKPATNQVDSGPIVAQARRQTVGTKAWFRVKCPGQDTATLSLFPHGHEYPG